MSEIVATPSARAPTVMHPDEAALAPPRRAPGDHGRARLRRPNSGRRAESAPSTDVRRRVLDPNESFEPEAWIGRPSDLAAGAASIASGFKNVVCITLYNEPFELLRNSLSALLLSIGGQGSSIRSRWLRSSGSSPLSAKDGCDVDRLFTRLLDDRRSRQRRFLGCEMRDQATKWEAEEAAAVAALAAARRARVQRGRVEVREPERPQPKPVPITFAEMVAQGETAADGSVDRPADVLSGRVRLESVL
jgi:hypothetical protein